MKKHIVRFVEQTKPASWSTPQNVDAICGVMVMGAKPIQGFHSVIELEGSSAIDLCSTCLVGATERSPVRLWMYLILPAEQADRVNSNTGFLE